jgi:hypothetical protein
MGVGVALWVLGKLFHVKTHHATFSGYRKIHNSQSILVPVYITSSGQKIPT